MTGVNRRTLYYAKRVQQTAQSFVKVSVMKSGRILGTLITAFVGLGLGVLLLALTSQTFWLLIGVLDLAVGLFTAGRDDLTSAG